MKLQYKNKHDVNSQYDVLQIVRHDLTYSLNWHSVWLTIIAWIKSIQCDKINTWSCFSQIFTACIKLIIVLMFNINKILSSTVTRVYFNIRRFIYLDIHIKFWDVLKPEQRNSEHKSLNHAKSASVVTSMWNLSDWNESQTDIWYYIKKLKAMNRFKP